MFPPVRTEDTPYIEELLHGKLTIRGNIGLQTLNFGMLLAILSRWLFQTVLWRKSLASLAKHNLIGRKL